MYATLTKAFLDLSIAGFFCRMSAEEERLYISFNGFDAGYITASDCPGARGTCQQVTRMHRGAVAAALRGAP